MDSEIGWYLYALCSHEALPPLTGIDGRSPLRLIVEDGIVALASPVSLAEFGTEALCQNLEDPRWLEEKVRLHETIMEAARAEGPLLPMRFGTIFLEPGRIRAVIRKNIQAVRETLELLRDKDEWGVRGWADRATLRAWVLRADATLRALSMELSAKPPGQAFFLKRKIEESASTKSQEREELLTRDAVEIIRGAVVELVESPSLFSEASPGETIVLNVACLVSRTSAAAFLAGLEEWNRAHGEEGVRLVASGPWPPYHFVPRLSHDG